MIFSIRFESCEQKKLKWVDNESVVGFHVQLLFAMLIAHIEREMKKKMNNWLIFECWKLVWI